MASKISNVAIITKIGSSEAEAAAVRVAKLLAASNVKTYTVIPLQIDGCMAIKQTELKNVKFDLVFAIGGDGTTLRAFRTIPGKVPLFSMNIGGHRGILSEAETDSIDEAISLILAGKYFYDLRVRIQASVHDNNSNIVFPPALNDIFITRINLTRTPVMSIKFMGDEIRQRMDGIVISTPTGSTGHSFSIGGPVLHEGMTCLILSPIAPINRMPQLVIPLEEVSIRSTFDSHLIVDGQEAFKVQAEKEVRISRFADDAIFLRLNKKGMRQLAKLGF